MAARKQNGVGQPAAEPRGLTGAQSRRHDIAVLGGGLTGLAAGMQAQAPVFEADSQVGGVATSDTVDGFTFDRGIHVLQTQNQKILRLIDDLGVEMGTRKRDAHIYSHGCYTPYPFQVNTAGLPIALRARCVRDFLNRAKHADPENYEQWIYRNLGDGFAETFLIPYSEKFWGVPPREMTHDWTGNRVPKPSTLQVIRGALWNKNTTVGTNSIFRYPLGGGYGRLAEAMRTRIDDVAIEHRAVALDAERRVVEFSNGVAVDYRVLINTIPLPELIGIITSGVPDDVREAASRLRTNSIHLVNLGIDRADVSNRHWMHFPEKDISFFRISFPHNFDSALAPPGTSSISVEVAYSETNPVDKARIVDRVIDDLERVGITRADERFLVRAQKDIPLAYCIYDKYRKNAVRTISSWLEQNNIITSGRYGLWTYFWSDESMSSGLNAGDKARRLLASWTEETGDNRKQAHG